MFRGNTDPITALSRGVIPAESPFPAETRGLASVVRDLAATMRPMDTLSPLLTSQEVADLLGVPLRTVQDWRRLRRGPKFARIGRHARYTAADVAAFIAQRTVDPAADAHGRPA